ncbi:hypothetical protein P0136_09100 [Lentisphaerota bacterium ZTH]|nr:hypothetical protein JYG24_13390 [Lentisphaerota bacterium]WET05520.1 hypothetical protein P0136_09100 [Lentisphaerota bacterium ZTH]
MSTSLFTKLVAVSAMMAAVSGFAAEKNMVQNGYAADAMSGNRWKCSKRLVFNPVDKCKGLSSFQANEKYTLAISPNFMKVEDVTNYRLSGWFKSAGKGPAVLYFGLIMYDRDFKEIKRKEVTVVQDTETKLVADAKFGDIKLMLFNCDKWVMSERMINQNRLLVAFDIKKNFTDLPNRNLGGPIAKFEKKGKLYEVTLKRPLQKTFNSGTMVRQQLNYGGYQYCAALEKNISDDWEEITADIKGIAQKGAPDNMFWPGTKYVKVVILANYSMNKDAKTLFTGISFMAAPEKK